MASTRAGIPLSPLIKNMERVVERWEAGERLTYRETMIDGLTFEMARGVMRNPFEEFAALPGERPIEELVILAEDARIALVNWDRRAAEFEQINQAWAERQLRDELEATIVVEVIRRRKKRQSFFGSLFP